MAVQAPQQPQNAQVLINGHLYGTPANANVGRSYVEHVVDYLKGSNGAYRGLQLIEKTAKAAALVFEELGDALSVFFADIAGKLGVATGCLVLPRLPDVTSKAWKALSNWGAVEGPEGYPLRGHVESVHDVAECTAAWGYAAALFSGCPAVKNAADSCNMVSDITGLSMAAEDYGMARKLSEQISVNDTALKERFSDTETEALLRMAKSIASVVSGVLGLLVLAFGGPILPAAALLAVSLASTIFSIASHFYKETRNFDLVKFFDKPRVPVAGGAAALIN